MRTRTIIENPPNAGCDLRGATVKIVEVYKTQRDRQRAIAVAEIVNVGPRYRGSHMRRGKQIYLYRGTVR